MEPVVVKFRVNYWWAGQLYRSGMWSRAAAEDVGQDPERPSIRVEEGEVLEHPMLYA